MQFEGDGDLEVVLKDRKGAERYKVVLGEQPEDKVQAIYKQWQNDVSRLKHKLAYMHIKEIYDLRTNPPKRIEMSEIEFTTGPAGYVNAIAQAVTEHFLLQKYEVKG